MTTAGNIELHKARRERIYQALAKAGRKGLATPEVAKRCALDATQARRQLMRLEESGVVWSIAERRGKTIARVWSVRPARRETT